MTSAFHLCRAAGIGPCLITFAALIAGTPRSAPAQSAPTSAKPEYLAASGENIFWLAEVHHDSTRVLIRRANLPFGSGERLSRRVAMMAGARDALYLLLYDNALYRFFPGGSRPERNLPGRSRPLALAADASHLYAIVTSDAAELMSPRDAQADGSTTPPVSAALALAAYDGGNWSVVAPCPERADPDGSARLLPARDGLLLVWRARGAESLEQAIFQPRDGVWRFEHRLDAPQLDDFWLVALESESILILAARTNDGTSLKALRWLGDEWRAIDLRTSAVPDGVHFTRYTGVFASGQRIGLLAVDSAGDSYLQFARKGVEPADLTIKLGSDFAPDNSALVPPFVSQTMVFALFALLGTMLILRRTSLMLPIELPPNIRLAIPWQRFLSWAIDFLPFCVAAAFTVQLDPMAGVSGLADWAVRAEMGDRRGPSADVLTWWLLSACGHAAYCLVMELAAGRTIGKVLTGLRLMSESSGRPDFGQIVLRNLIRLVEMYPPFWAVQLMTLMTRNRQRLGDVIARTLVVRSVTLDAAGAPQAPPSDARDSEHHGPPSGEA